MPAPPEPAAAEPRLPAGGGRRRPRPPQGRNLNLPPYVYFLDSDVRFLLGGCNHEGGAGRACGIEQGPSGTTEP